MILNAEETMNIENTLHNLRALKLFHDAGLDVKKLKVDIYAIADGYGDYCYPMNIAMEMMEQVLPIRFHLYPYSLENSKSGNLESSTLDAMEKILEMIYKLDLDAHAEFIGLCEQVEQVAEDTFKVLEILQLHFNTSHVFLVEMNIENIKMEFDNLIRGKDNNCFAIILDEDNPFFYSFEADEIINLVIEAAKHI